ncbi:AP-4 complex subunit epsilon, putative [Plasmodium knowlesi strain H]|uniref:AP-4 complex subunit epsilon, putative n=3 Tax=Plasmodium knowlesi TaxID=5850 RepID=A0A1A7VNK1_PLAKH|nr:AP-4 complex subunit epsilon, putative [Plasmodium knowlesi strain H]OTN67375.1 putative AP-4 complex subunit epsilon [Plasmodium knowlesi]CAA9987308.1 AP-4 complex subunit epsilon, putative [Plasmodium knowlesi strain H]SBO23415.1 AP-4 complex subunit epsilon, putative [Plasmodium knowlesi strain H]SBO24677.1 AP-4 complex subunit epsilon, putative [Plasmodium knowlesi strain H]VVS76782.1 AP-4 complex subunit epsilon, putative [Plasmodium knowlesi strain H]
MLGFTGSCLSKEFFDLAKSIGEARSKQEEDRIICNEIVLLKSRFADPSASVKQIKEYLIRAIYIEMLGHDASFAYIHAVKLAHEKNILCKRTGYLSCNLFLNKDHELMLLLINTIQKDLKSDNHLEIWAALNCVCKLLNSEMIPAIFPIIKNLLNHKNELIRKKVCMLLHKMYLIDPSLIKEIDLFLKKLLCDVDPSVMGASLNLIFCIAKNDITYCIKLVPYLVSILKQICENKLPKDYDYHRIPAPWIQIKILAIFRILGYSNKKISEQMYEVLQKTMQRADFGINVGYAIIYECVKTIATIYPSHHLLELASLSISRFISSDNHNLKYVGVTGLALIVKINPMYASKHQLAVVDCLEDKDETLKMKTLDLLYQMTNPLNVKVIVDKLLFHVENSLDIHFKHDLACKIIQLIERYTPDDIWFLNTINSLFLSVGELLDESYSYSLIKLLKDSSMCLDSDSGDDLVRSELNEEVNCGDDNLDNSNVPYAKEGERANTTYLNIAEMDNKGEIISDPSPPDEEEGVSSHPGGKPISGNYDLGEKDVSVALDDSGKVHVWGEIRKDGNSGGYGRDDNHTGENHISGESNRKKDQNELKGKKKINDDVYNLRKYAVNTYITMLENNENIPFILMQIICWVLGEYSYLCDIENYTTEDIIDLLCECLEKTFNNPDRVKSCIITAIFKLCCFNNVTDHVVAKKLIEKYKNSKLTDMQQRCYEYSSILNNPTLIKNVFSISSKQKMIMDENLSFLNPFVDKYLASGGKAYIKKELRETETNFESAKNSIPVLNFTPYELPINNRIHIDTFHTSNSGSAYERNYKYDSPEHISLEDRTSNTKERERTFKLNVVGPKKWTKEACKVGGKNNNERNAQKNAQKNGKKKKKKKKKKDNQATYQLEGSHENANRNKMSKEEGQKGLHKFSNMQGEIEPEEGEQNNDEQKNDELFYDSKYGGQGRKDDDDEDDDGEDDNDDEEEDDDEDDDDDSDDDDDNDNDDDDGTVENEGGNDEAASDGREDEKRMDGLGDYYDQNYERFDERDIHNLGDYKNDRENNNNNSPFYKQERAHSNNNATVTHNELTEKEKMAAALFNGLISNNSSVDYSRNNYSSSFSSKKNHSLLSNRNYFYSKSHESRTDEKGIHFLERRNSRKFQRESVESSSQQMEKKNSSSNPLENCSNKLDEMRKSKYAFDMLDLNEPSAKRDFMEEEEEENRSCKEEDKNLWNSISSQKKAVFLNSTTLSIFQIIKKIENNLNANVVEVSKKEALMSCIYSSNKVLVKIKIEENKLVFLVKSAEISIIDSVFDILRNLFHV